MSLRLAALLLVTALFGALTAVALAQVGILGIFRPHFQSWGPAQVFADLVILAVLACFWMVADGRRSGVPAWPFVVLTLLAGSFGPLLYLVTREFRGRSGATDRA
ncbi:MAG: hypothetical protein RJA59_2234 [Pseudomonadota bacterium]